MATLILSTEMTVDGVITVEDWFAAEGSHDAACRALFERSAAMVMGRTTYEGLAGFCWPDQSGPLADLINPMPKFVASRTLAEPLEWNSSLIDGDAVDELWFWSHPAVWGAGERPFRGGRGSASS